MNFVQCSPHFTCTSFFVYGPLAFPRCEFPPRYVQNSVWAFANVVRLYVSFARVCQLPNVSVKCSGIFAIVAAEHAPFLHERTLYHSQFLTPIIYNHHRNHTRNYSAVGVSAPPVNNLIFPSDGHKRSSFKARIGQALHLVGVTIIRRPRPSRSVLDFGC